MQRVIWLWFLLWVGCAHTAAVTEPAVARNGFIALLQGSPADVVWDEAQQRLLIVDNVGNRVWVWTDAAGVASRPLATLALPEGTNSLPANVTLGQAALLRDGTLLVARFGAPGKDALHSAVVVVHPDGKSELVPGLDRSAHRLGVVATADGTSYDATFAATSGKPTGQINQLDLTRGETKVAEGFGKLIGLAVIDDRLYASDQTAGVIFDAPLRALPAQASEWHPFASLPKPDQICRGPDGSLFSGQYQRIDDAAAPIAVRWIAKDGQVSVLRTTPDVTKPSGVSYDAHHKRLFVADGGDKSHVGVHIFAVP